MIETKGGIIKGSKIKGLKKFFPGNVNLAIINAKRIPKTVENMVVANATIILFLVFVRSATKKPKENFNAKYVDR